MSQLMPDARATGPVHWNCMAFSGDRMPMPRVRSFQIELPVSRLWYIVTWGSK